MAGFTSEIVEQILVVRYNLPLQQHQIRRMYILPLCRNSLYLVV